MLGDSNQAINAFRRAAEQHCLLRSRVSGCKAFESVPQDRIARADPVWWEVALKHRAIRSERRDTGFDVGPVGSREVGRRGRFLARMEIKYTHQHAKPEIGRPH